MNLFHNRAISVVLKELSQHYHINSGTYAKILCPFHNENTPSCSINLHNSSIPVGYFHCFGCGEKGNWNKLATKQGWEKITDGAENEIAHLAPNLLNTMYNIKKELLQVELEDDWSIIDNTLKNKLLFEVNSDFRGISKELLVKLGCKTFIQEKTQEVFLIIPVCIDGTTKGIIKARMDKDPDKPGYINSKGSWVKNYGLLGWDYAINMKEFKKRNKIVLVEGPRDALQLLQHKIPAVAILGSKNWSKSKKEFLINLEPKEVILLFDNDKAGRKAGSQIYHELDNLLNVKKIKLPDRKVCEKKLDPANLYYKMLINIYKKSKIPKNFNKFLHLCGD